ncbi:MAG: F0F1 ATP synthase subunit delta, partial [Bifidobacteriaceae bacterium]|nr:F0F1 ATP synthase subunit delta [Bifidobacteriaceae bacterium]
LEELLSQHYGQSVKANLTIDRAVVGGLTIRLGDDLIDATVLARLGQARRQLATQNPPNKGATNHG